MFNRPSAAHLARRRIDLVARATLALSGEISHVQLAIAGPADRPGFVVAPANSATMGIRFHIGWGSVCLNLEAASIRNRVVVGRAAEAMIGSVAQPMLRATSLTELRQAMSNCARTLSVRAFPKEGHARVLHAVALMRRGMPIPFGVEVADLKRAHTNRRLWSIGHRWALGT